MQNPYSKTFLEIKFVFVYSSTDFQNFCGTFKD